MKFLLIFLLFAATAYGAAIDLEHYDLNFVRLTFAALLKKIVSVYMDAYDAQILAALSSPPLPPGALPPLAPPPGAPLPPPSPPPPPYAPSPPPYRYYYQRKK
jgi:hypothetical protein